MAHTSTARAACLLAALIWFAAPSPSQAQIGGAAAGKSAGRGSGACDAS